MLELIQWTAIIFALFAWSRALLRFKDRKVRLGDFIFWTIVWSGVIVVATLPGIPAMLAEIAGIKRPVDLAVYLGIMLLFYLIYRLYTKVEQIEQNITKLVRTIAIENPQKPGKK